MQADLEAPLVSFSEQSRFAAWVAERPTVTAVHDVTADGLAAAVLWLRGCAALDWPAATAWAPRPGQPQAVPTEACVALGDVDADITPRLWPTVLPKGDVLWRRVGCAAVWLWNLWDGLPGVDAEPMAWLAALGCIEQAGRVPVPWLTAARATHTGKFLRQAAELLDAAARAHDYRPDVALRVLQRYDTPRALVQSRDDEDVRLLHALHAEVEAARQQGRRSAPYLSGRLAVVAAALPCRLEDELALHWGAKFPQRVVLVGNEAYAPGHVCYAAAGGGMAAVDFLRSAGWPAGFGARGVMPLRLWHEALARLHVPSGELPGLTASL